MTDTDAPFNDELVVADARNFTPDDPFAGGAVMAGPPEQVPPSSEPSPQTTDDHQAAAPSGAAPSGASADGDIEFPFFMTSAVPAAVMRQFELQADGHQAVIDQLVAAHQAQRRQTVIEMQRRARQLHDDIVQTEKERRPDNIVDIADALTRQVKPDPAPPWFGITLACLLIPADSQSRDPEDKRSFADLPPGTRAQSLVASYGRNYAKTSDGGHLEASPNKLTIRKGSEQALEMIFAEAQSRGWDSIEASGTQEFCRNLCALAQKYNMKVTAYPNFPGRLLKPPYRYTPLPEPDLGTDSPRAESGDETPDRTDTDPAAQKSPDSRFPRAFRDSVKPLQPEDPVTGEAYQGGCGPERPTTPQTDLDDDIENIPSLTPP